MNFNISAPFDPSHPAERSFGIRIVPTNDYAKGPTSQQSIPSKIAASDGDQFACSVAYVSSAFFHLMVEVGGQVEEARLARAVRLIMDEEPVLGSNFVSHWRKPFWQRRDDLDNLTLCSVVEIEDDINPPLQSYFEQFIDPKVDPLLEVRIFRGVTDMLCFKVSHVPCDAFGSVDLFEKIMLLYRKLKEHPNLRVEPNLRSRSVEQVWRQFGFKQRASVLWRQVQDLQKRVFPLHKRLKFFSPQGPRTRPRYVVELFSEEDSQAVYRWRKSHNLSLNSVATAAYLRVIHRYQQPEPGTPLKIQHTVNLRRYMPQQQAETICNLVGYVFIDIGTELGDDLLETAQKVQAAWKKLENVLIGTGELLPFLWGTSLVPFGLREKLLGHMMTRFPEVLPPVMSTGFFSPSKLQLYHDCLEYPVENMYFLPAIVYPPLVLPVLMSCNNLLSLITTYCDNGEGSHIHRDVIRDIIAELPRSQKAE